MLSTDHVGFLHDADGDLDLSTGRLQLAAGLAGAKQGVDARIRLVRGEWFLNRAAGIAYYENDYTTAAQALLGQRYDEGKVRREFRAAILDCPSIAAVTRLEIAFNPSTRKLTVTWAARCAFGDLVTGATEV